MFNSFMTLAVQRHKGGTDSHSACSRGRKRHSLMIEITSARKFRVYILCCPLQTDMVDHCGPWLSMVPLPFGDVFVVRRMFQNKSSDRSRIPQCTTSHATISGRAKLAPMPAHSRLRCSQQGVPLNNAEWQKVPSIRTRVGCRRGSLDKTSACVRVCVCVCVCES
jgi:hypothetical protein